MADDVARLRTALADRYRIERELGQGGMATVYLAEDLKHHRQVAIKVLKPELAAVLGAERFVQEITTTAALQHPNILPLFDSGSADGFLFYVMPFVEGETLRSRLDRETQLGVDESVKMVSEVADALDYAHRHGVVHRDIKPENILIHEGRPMVADFGIALAVSAAAGGRMTETGLSLGTPHYMSPEQATAEKHITPRSDIYSLGAVLYEMLSGNPPHVGASAQQIIMKIVTEEAAPVTQMRKSVPANVAAAVSKALERLPADRFDSAKEFAAALQNPAFRLAEGEAGAALGAAGSSHRGWQARLRDPFDVALAVVAVAGVVAFAMLMRRAPATAAAVPPIQFVLSTTDSVRPIYQGDPWSGAISPDGGTVVYVGVGADGRVMLYSQRTNAFTARPIPGTVGADQPYFSPDGSWIGFEQNGQERKVRLDGGSPVTIVSSGPEENGATWTSGGQIVIGASARTAGLSRVGAGGGQLVPVTRVDSAKGARTHLWPIATPDPNTVVFTIWYGSLESSKLAAVSLGDGRVTPLGVSGIRPLAVVDGHLIYLQADGTVMAIPFDVRQKRVTGSPVPVHDPVQVVSGFNGNSPIYVSRGGAMMAGAALSTARLVWVSRDGTIRPAVPGARRYTQIALAPDGRRIAALISNERGSDVWIYDPAAATLSRLTTMGNIVSVKWSHDGTDVVFVAPDTASHSTVVWSQPATGGAPPRKLFGDPDPAPNAALAPDGKSLVIQSLGSYWDLLRVPLDSTRAARPYVVSQFDAVDPKFSPDGKWVAYASDETGQFEAYVRSFPDPSTRIQISTGGSGGFGWSRDGRSLYYVVNVSHPSIVAAHLSFAPDIHIVGRDTIAKLPDRFTGDVQGVSPDGQRVLALDAVSNGFELLVSPNWITELRRRLTASAGGAGQQ